MKRKCLNERRLEAAAARLTDLGIRAEEALGASQENRSLPAIPQPLLMLLAHARECLRCREIMVLFQETAMAMRGESGRGEGNRGEGGRGESVEILRLVSPLSNGRHRGEDEPNREFDAAAQSPGGPNGVHLPAAARVLTLTTDDERFVVRIFANEGGEGATAILLGIDAPAGLALRIAGKDYSFDANGQAQLPAFPGEAVGLVRRGGE